MERLTNRQLNEYGRVDYAECRYKMEVTGDCTVDCAQCDFTIKIDKKLKAYEDAEEQGLLIHLPCKVGTLVYEAYSIAGISGVDEHRLKFEDIPNFGKTVFLTQEQAEQALQALKEGVE